MNNLWNPVDGSTAIIISYGNELAALKEAIWGFMIGPSKPTCFYGPRKKHSTSFVYKVLFVFNDNLMILISSIPSIFTLPEVFNKRVKIKLER